MASSLEPMHARGTNWSSGKFRFVHLVRLNVPSAMALTLVASGARIGPAGHEGGGERRRSWLEEGQMNTRKQPGGTDARHRGKTDEARPQEGGRAGGQHSGGEKSDKSREGGSQEQVEREKAERGTGSLT
jgi:hypothetical protein